MKRFEYRYIFTDKPEDPNYTKLYRDRFNPFYQQDLSEFSVISYLDSYKEAIKRFPSEMMRFHDFVRLEVTGKKFRTSDWKIKIYWHLLKRKLR